MDLDLDDSGLQFCLPFICCITFDKLLDFSESVMYMKIILAL
jgi:hypothetical protein